MSHRPTSWIELAFDFRSECSALNARESRNFVDLQHAIHTSHIHTDDGQIFIARRFKASGDVCPTTERNQNGICGQGGVNYLEHFIVAARVYDYIRQPTTVTSANPHEIAQAFTISVHDPV